MALNLNEKEMKKLESILDEKDPKKKYIFIRISSNEKFIIAKEAIKEGKSVSQYMIDAHLSHCHGKYGNESTCPTCGMKNIRQGIKCWACNIEY